MGRFISPDPSGLDYADQTNPQSLNLYSYVLNNPIALIDPTGLRWDCATATVGVQVDANGNPSGGTSSSPSCRWVGDTLDGNAALDVDLSSFQPMVTMGNLTPGQTFTGDFVTAAKYVPMKPKLLDCASDFAHKTSIAGPLQAHGIGTAGAGKFVTDALAGNAFAGLVDAIRNGPSIVDFLMGGTHMGVGGNGPMQKGVAGVAQDAAVAGAWSSITGAGQTVQGLNGASSLASTGVSASKFANIVGAIKLSYDAGSYGAGALGCLTGVVR
jgi:uncharacterized protein RhaS with RHS repeats